MDGGRVAHQLYVGVDVAADTCTAAWLAPGGEPVAPVTGAQTAAGFAARDRHLRATVAPGPATLVVPAATGNSWVALAVVNPRQAHHCAKARPRRAKTDALDARDLAQLAAALRPAPWTPPVLATQLVRS
jgi:transposase